MKTEFDTRALLNVKEMCEYLGIGQTKARELLSNPATQPCGVYWNIRSQCSFTMWKYAIKVSVIKFSEN